MCRLFAWHSEAPISLADALGEDSPRLSDLSRQHCDGWGMCYSDGQGLVRVRDVAPAHDSAAFREAQSAVHATDAIVHLRLATAGLSVCEVNTHPFVTDSPIGRMAFCHNGGIRQGAELDALIDDDLQEALEGDTDSEQYLAALVTALRRTDGDLVEAYRHLLPPLTRIRHSSLNALLLTDTDLFVLCRNIPARRPTGMPEDYYELQWDVVDGVFSAWSREVRSRAGRALADGDLLHLDRASGTVTVHRVMP